MRLGREDLGVRAVGSAGGRDGGGAREGVRTKMGTAEREREDVGGQAGTRAWWKRRDSGAEAEMDVG